MQLAIIAIIGFLINCQPSEPFLSPYIETTRDVTHVQLVQDVYPWNTFASLFFILPAGICAQIFGSRRVIYLGLLSRQATRILLLYGTGVFPMVVTQITYGLATSINQAVWYSYVYSLVQASSYATSTAWVRGGYSFGNVVGCVVGQLMVSLYVVPLKSLFWMSWILSTIGSIVALLYLPIPTPTPSFNNTNNNNTYEEIETNETDNESESNNSYVGHGNVGLEQQTQQIHQIQQIHQTQQTQQQTNEEDLYTVVRHGHWIILKQHLYKLFRDKTVVVWCVAWWVGQSTNVLITNYYTAAYLEAAVATGTESCGTGTPSMSSSTFASSSSSSSLFSSSSSSSSLFVINSTSPSSSIHFENPFGTLEALNQIIATLAVALPALIGSSSSSTSSTSSSSTGSTSINVRYASSISATLLVLCATFLFISLVTSCGTSLFLSYGMFVAYTGSFSALMAWSSIELSKASTKINGGISGKQSILFGVNGFIALLLASLVQLVAVATGLSAHGVLFLCVLVLATGGLLLCVPFSLSTAATMSSALSPLPQTPLLESEET